MTGSQSGKQLLSELVLLPGNSVVGALRVGAGRWSVSTLLHPTLRPVLGRPLLAGAWGPVGARVRQEARCRQ